MTAIDFDPVFVADVKKRMNPQWPFEVFVHDILSGPVPGRYDGIYALDVLEHIEPAQEHVFMENVMASLAPHGVVIIGMPSLESQEHASPQFEGWARQLQVHVRRFAGLMAQHISTTSFMFSMNDEVVHTGHQKMAHYIFALCCEPKP